ncbi:MAG: TraR/DksA family transcriptional regulator [Planctomycetota bacterium]|nr:MAG: TraR/DksA family transcriptional regulator [Planctomycetota bacterium]
MPKPSKAALKKHREHLLALLQHLGVKIERMEDSVLRSDGETSADEVDEFGSDTYLQEFQVGLIENEDEIRRQVFEALERIETGTYGRCEACRGEIPTRRLEALPYARYCVSCQQKAENGELGDD